MWIRPCASVTGTRCTRCGPPSKRIRVHTVSPLNSMVTWLMPPIGDLSSDITSTDQPLRSAHALYMSNRSWANKLASSPPSAPRISTMMFLPSFGSAGRSNTFNWASSSAMRSIAASNSACSCSRSAPLASAISSRAASALPSASLYSRMHCTNGVCCLYLREASRNLFWSFKTSAVPRLSSRATYSASIWERRSNTMLRLRAN